MSRIATRALNSTLTYSIVCAVFLFAFSEELGYIVYKSSDAGYYISALSFIVPIMYLDHVTDSMLKGIGEQVFSMWVNITDSLLSVFFVWLLIPKMGIMGYAVVIVIMESYNFLLSFLRLRKRISFSINLFGAIIPLCFTLLSTFLTKRIFCFDGSTSPTVWLILKMLFSLSATLFFSSIYNIFSRKQKSI